MNDNFIADALFALFVAFVIIGGSLWMPWLAGWQ